MSVDTKSAAAEQDQSPLTGKAAGAAEVLDFWLGLGQVGWYAVNPAVDDEIRSRFAPLWEAALAGGLQEWITTPEGALAYVVVTDQFPRNIFRGDGRSFATDARARAVAAWAIRRGHDLRIPEPQRQFFYLPAMHSESLPDQNRCLCWLLTRMPETGVHNTAHARAHREVIRRFGRFPYRNAALGRETSPKEQAFLAAGGYASIVAELG